MTFDEALAALTEPQQAFPLQAMLWFEANWADAGDRLTARCESFLDGEDAPDFTDRSFFFAIHICAAHRQTRLHAPLCAMLLNADVADALLGDALQDTVRGMLIATFDGDLAPMQAVIEAASSDMFVADAALLAIAYLTQDGRLPLARTEAYLTHLFETIPREPDFMWAGFATAVAALGLQALVPRVETLFREGSVPRDAMRLADFRQDLADRLADSSGRAVFDAMKIAPFTDPVTRLANWYSFDGRPQRGSGTIVNDLRDVGRNDPCPCGSGKKYKKCCLRAA